MRAGPVTSGHPRRRERLEEDLTRKNADPALLTRLRRHRSRIVEAFLWVLLTVVLLAFGANMVMYGPGALVPSLIIPNLVFILLIVTGLLLNQRQRIGVSVWMIVSVLLLAGVAGVLSEGVQGNVTSLMLFFIPLVLSALLLGRQAVLITTAVTLLAVGVAPLLHQGGLPGMGTVQPDSGWATATQFGLVYLTVAFFLDRFGVVFLDTLRTSMYQEMRLHEEAAARVEAREALLEGQRLNDAIVENLPGIFFMLDREGTFFRLNRSVTDDLGYSGSEVMAAGPELLLPTEEPSVLRRWMSAVFEQGEASGELTITAKDGRQVPYFVRATRVTLGGNDYLAGIGIDRSEIDEVQARVQILNVELRDRLERITALREIDRAMTGNMDLDATLNVVMQQVMQRLQVDAVSILLYRSASQTLRYGASRGFKGAALRRTDLRLGEGLAGRVALEREALTLSGRDEFMRAFEGASSLQGESFQSYMAVPLISKGQLQGVLELFDHQPLDPDDDWKDFLVALATQAALAIDAARMFDDLDRSNQELRLAYETTIEGWARALDLKDSATVGHSRRVTDLTVRLARRMGMSEEELVHVRRGALLHDIGKMGVPDHILSKPGPLSDEEQQVMRQHATFAHEFLAPIPFLRPALEIPYCHHERFDGTGYPLGLAGDQIPLAARLFSVVDVFDALTSDRPYRPAWSSERTLEYIASEAGKRFDPAVVEEFMEMMRGPMEKVQRT